MPGFNEKVWALFRKIPKGKVTTYKLVAKALGKPNATRAVGNACRANLHAPKIPCHRVVKSNGSVGGYAYGQKKKIALLAKEGIKVKNGKIMCFDDRLFSYFAKKDK